MGVRWDEQNRTFALMLVYSYIQMIVLCNPNFTFPYKRLLFFVCDCIIKLLARYIPNIFLNHFTVNKAIMPVGRKELLGVGGERE